MRIVLDEGSIDFEGDFYDYSGVTTAARPVQEHLPLKIGAMGGPKSMELAGEIADRIMVAGTPEDWVSWLRDTYHPAGLNHALVSFTDPFTLKAWAGIEVDGLPELREHVMSAAA